MNTLLFFFAFPIAVIIFSIVLEKLLKNPIIVASIIFAVFIILTFAVFGVNFLIATLAYTILALITALVVRLLCNENDEDEDNNNNACGGLSNLLNTNSTNSNNNSTGCGCNRYRRF